MYQMVCMKRDTVKVSMMSLAAASVGCTRTSSTCSVSASGMFSRSLLCTLWNVDLTRSCSVLIAAFVLVPSFKSHGFLEKELFLQPIHTCAHAIACVLANSAAHVRSIRRKTGLAGTRSSSSLSLPGVGRSMMPIVTRYMFPKTRPTRKTVMCHVSNPSFQSGNKDFCGRKVLEAPVPGAGTKDKNATTLASITQSAMSIWYSSSVKMASKPAGVGMGLPNTMRPVRRCLSCLPGLKSGLPAIFPLPCGGIQIGRMSKGSVITFGDLVTSYHGFSIYLIDLFRAERAHVRARVRFQW
mmetsp:Transcript_18680/g.47751  ORF Transcript_18680/g.47751 Transcript_18680/m.47751 type:complete len:297 (-) Transcript_18680:174-1064(-)